MAQESKRILIVDDHVHGRDALRMVLEFSGYVVRDAPDGKRALAIALSWQPDVICLDLMLPEMTGYEVAAHVLNSLGEKKRPLLIATTSLGSAVHRQKAAEAGFDAYILKPYDLDSLLELISEGASPRSAALSRTSAGGKCD